MKPQRNTEAGEEDTEWEKIYSGAVRARKISLCVLILNSDFSLWFHENLCRAHLKKDCAGQSPSENDTGKAREAGVSV